jgi:hypothetical protein
LSGRQLYILNISNPESVVQSGLYQFPESESGYWKIKVFDNLAFLDNSVFSGNDPARLVILDLSNPTKPAQVASYKWASDSAMGGVSKKAVYIGDYAGLHVVDFSDAKHPREIGYYDVLGGFSSIALGQNNLIYALSTHNGLFTLRYVPLIH